MNAKTKIVSLERLKKIVSLLRRKNRKIAFTNGCFDLVHFGHVSYLTAAKKNNRILVVGVNSDSSVRRIKGKTRPITPQRARAGVLAALACVDYVVIFNEDTPYRVIKALKPDILIKGADWQGKEIVGQDIVESHGGKIELIKYINGFSTSRIIDRIVKNCAG
ncbi:MAG TPA: D-glycero-beta-D-manno-heptose 1-phosphate adenylyltransferase [Candidatus Omnitrophota bacterium]|nr:D-glycero-beta-D-manno-heptose 1-phosphate adenylyltransferase [Candidatus Omnitrophota bacterium]HPD83910.1 D-glycero-beta-D-manno-heptose 1-phosphate adenylyltransferase [Candidatus Omnitrophota bacterium]HRZ02767.1 D-glycero-beta-D-manno-heptose 1-phosphate adenylyltransferase [Candidatus Omnitrophota bacterium]